VRLSSFAASLVLVALAGCGTAETTPPDGEVVVSKIEGAPTLAAAPAQRTDVPGDVAPTALSSLHGAVLMGTAAGLFVGTLADDQPKEMTLVPDDGGPTATGAISLLARRSGGGVLVRGANGLFHDLEGFLVLSPLDSVVGAGGMGSPAPKVDGALKSIDVFGEGAAEELWITTSTSVVHLAGGKLETLEIADAKAPPDGAVGAGPGQALLMAGGEVFFVDVAKPTAQRVATALGALHGHDRAEDDTVYLATDGGLLVRDKTGKASLRTLAPAGKTAAPVLGVAASFGAVMVTTGSALVRIDPEGATTIGMLAGGPGGVAVDGNGDVWAADQGKLARFSTGAAISFGADVKPFFAKHCSSCHDAGQNGAPKDDFLDYATAKERGALILKRLSGSGVPAMPPVTTEVLTPADYAVVTRWVGGGFEP
jgi:cytochrome c5